MNPEDLVTFRELEELKYRYLRSLDTKDWTLFAECFTPDATASYGANLEFSDRDGIVAFMTENLGPTMITVHQVHHPELTVDGDTATAVWSLSDRVIMTEHRLLLDGTSFYRDTYVRDSQGVWRISHTGYERVYEQMVSMDDLPSFKLTANRFAP